MVEPSAAIKPIPCDATAPPEHNQEHESNDHLPVRLTTNTVLTAHAEATKENEDPKPSSSVVRRSSTLKSLSKKIPLLSRSSIGEISASGGMNVRDILSEVHGTHVCTRKDALIMTIIVCFIAFFAWGLTKIDRELVLASNFLEELGFFGHVIFFLLFIFVGLPFGYNWTTLVLIVGFAYGWSGIISANVGTAASATVTYYGSRSCLFEWAQRRIGRFSRKKRLYLMASRQVIENPKAGILMLVILRMQPMLTFGMVNTFLGAFCRLPLITFLATTLVGSQTDIVKLISISVMIRGLGSFEAATKGEAGKRNLIFQCCVIVFVIVGALVLARYLVVRVLPQVIAENETIEMPRISSVTENISAEVVGTTTFQSNSCVQDRPDEFDI